MTSPSPRPRKSRYAPAHDFVPETGKPRMVADGIEWLRAPLPFELDHINLWLLEGATGWTIVDSGFNFDVMKAAWDEVFAQRFGADSVEKIFITHFHPDHFGLGGWLAERTNAPLLMTAPEFGMAKSLTDPALQEDLISLYRPYYEEAGVDVATRDELLGRRFTYQKIVHRLPDTYTPVKPGDTVNLGGRDWRMLGGYGHCPEHAALHDPAGKVLIAGDMILPDISPNISFFPDAFLSPNPVAAYLDTLDRIVAEVPDDVLVLPSHGVPFRGLHKRAGELKEHHAKRLEKLRGVLRERPMTAFEAMTGLFAHRALTRASDIFFALGETLAHIVYDIQEGRVRKEMRNGVAVYSLI